MSQDTGWALPIASSKSLKIFSESSKVHSTLRYTESRPKAGSRPSGAYQITIGEHDIIRLPPPGESNWPLKPSIGLGLPPALISFSTRHRFSHASPNP